MHWRARTKATKAVARVVAGVRPGVLAGAPAEVVPQVEAGPGVSLRTRPEVNHPLKLAPDTFLAVLPGLGVVHAIALAVEVYRPIG